MTSSRRASIGALHEWAVDLAQPRRGHGKERHHRAKRHLRGVDMTLLVAPGSHFFSGFVSPTPRVCLVSVCESDCTGWRLSLGRNYHAMLCYSVPPRGTTIEAVSW